MIDKPIKKSISLVVYNKDRTKILLVKRPDEPGERWPNMWSLPSGSLKKGENYDDAICRVSRDKLGVIVEKVKFIGKGSADRGAYITHLREYEVKIIKGKPFCPQPVKGITQYTEWMWGDRNDLKPAAKLDSLCSSIFLETTTLSKNNIY